MAEMMATIVRTALQAWQFQRPNPTEGLGRLPGPSNGNNGLQPNLGNPLVVIKEWSPKDIGYFDPEYEGTGPVVSVGKSVFYWDVFSFID